MSGRPWTAKETERLRELFPNSPTPAVARALGRSYSCVAQRARLLVIAKSPEFLVNSAGRFNKGIHRSAATEFKKGSVPANKGLRRPGWAPGRMAETQFKPGVRSGAAAKNWCPIGTVRKDGEGFLRIKVREGRKGEAYGFGNTKIWPLLNRHVWEQHNGPIPPGHAICFRDGDRSHCEIGNLELVSRADLARRNQMWNRMPRALAEVIQLQGALNRKLRRMEEKQNAGLAESSFRDA